MVLIMRMRMSVGIVRGEEGISLILLLISVVGASVFLQKYEKLENSELVNSEVPFFVNNPNIVKYMV